MSRTPAQKPSLSGVRIKARKGAVKAQAKHEPTVFRDQLVKHLESVPEGDFEATTNKLIQAGSTLELNKYAEALFELFFTLKPYVEVLNKLIRRYKYLQRPLETEAIPTLLQYIHRWDSELRGQDLSYDWPLDISKDVSTQVISVIFKAYLAEQSMDHLSKALKAGNIKDLLLFFPPNKRDSKTLEAFFKGAGIPQVAEWYTKKQTAVFKEAIISELKDATERGDTNDDIIKSLQTKQEENPLPEADLAHCIWQGLMASVDWSARPDQIEGLALREVTKYAPILEPFCDNAKTQVALINSVQGYCYEDTRIIKVFPQILKVLYNTDCISDQAIIYWHQKGSKPQGRQHFLNATASLVKFLQEQDSDEEDE
ncbi:armadillo-type protein [Flagelloscypha sp. PMI_526]|nr:armadillo-type protein [Flagelloscypha sp. PMI_526]